MRGGVKGETPEEIVRFTPASLAEIDRRADLYREIRKAEAWIEQARARLKELEEEAAELQGWINEEVAAIRELKTKVKLTPGQIRVREEQYALKEA